MIFGSVYISIVRNICLWAVISSMLSLLFFVGIDVFLYGRDVCQKLADPQSFYIVQIGEICLPLGRQIWEIVLIILTISLLTHFLFLLVLFASLFLNKKDEHRMDRQSVGQKIIKWVLCIYTGAISAWVSFVAYVGLRHNSGGEYCTYTEYDGRWFHILLEEEPCFINFHMFITNQTVLGIFLYSAYAAVAIAAAVWTKVSIWKRG